MSTDWRWNWLARCYVHAGCDGAARNGGRCNHCGEQAPHAFDWRDVLAHTRGLMCSGESAVWGNEAVDFVADAPVFEPGSIPVVWWRLSKEGQWYVVVGSSGKKIIVAFVADEQRAIDVTVDLSRILREKELHDDPILNGTRLETAEMEKETTKP